VTRTLIAFALILLLPAGAADAQSIAIVSVQEDVAQQQLVIRGRRRSLRVPECLVLTDPRSLVAAPRRET
jgi:hypothetical protein